MFPSAGRPTPRDWASIRHSLFFAVLLEEERQRRLGQFTEAFGRHHRLAGTRRPDQTLHASLLSLANKETRPPSESRVAFARSAGETVFQSPLKVTLNRVESWPRSSGQWPLVMVGDEGVIGLERLHEAIALAMGVRPDSGFKAHVTLMWGRDSIVPQYVRPQSFTVREFVLVHSHVGASQYEIKARFPLVHG